MRRRFALVLLATLAAAPAAAAPVSFSDWLEQSVWPEAKAAGVSRATFDHATAGLMPDWSLPEVAKPGTRPPALDQSQTEFGAPGAYFGEKGLDALAKAGTQKLATWKKTLDAIVQRYGVPAPILVAIWAKESGYGAAALPEPAIRALATEAYAGARKATFRPELIAALQILERGDITPDKMRASWAGALGQPQFLPSQFLKYAVDFDGDGRRDIWDSVPDTLASIAHYLKEEGWNPARGWGLEATVPGAVACTLEGPEQGKPMGAWAKLGVTQTNGKPLPIKGDRLGHLLMPAGRFGPAFIVSENFYVLKNYNYSDLYALYIGHLADRFADNLPFATAWQKGGGFKRGEVKAMQDALLAAGYDVGKADGFVGFKTRIAVGLWQKTQGQAATCFPDAAMIKAISG